MCDAIECLWATRFDSVRKYSECFIKMINNFQRFMNLLTVFNKQYLMILNCNWVIAIGLKQSIFSGTPF